MFETRDRSMKPSNSILSALRIQHSEFMPFCLQWVLGTFLGFFLSLLFVEVGEKAELGAIEGIVGGAIIGLMQTLAFSQWLPLAWLWMLANAIAWGLLGLSDFGAIGWYAPRTDLLGIRLTDGAMFGAIAGLWLGIWQWLILRKYLFDAWRWILVNLGSWSLALAVGWGLGGILRAITNLFVSEVIGLAIAWTIVSSTTGLALTGLMSQTLIYYRKFGKARFIE
jgi:hypothetical protein